MVKKVAVINDLSGLGKCSLTAAIPVLSVMGVQACPLPTAILSNQTGYESYFYDDYTDHIDAYAEEWVFDLFDDMDIITFLYSDVYLNQEHPYHFYRFSWKRAAGRKNIKIY